MTMFDRMAIGPRWWLGEEATPRRLRFRGARDLAAASLSTSVRGFDHRKMALNPQSGPTEKWNRARRRAATKEKQNDCLARRLAATAQGEVALGKRQFLQVFVVATTCRRTTRREHPRSAEGYALSETPAFGENMTKAVWPPGKAKGLPTPDPGQIVAALVDNLRENDYSEVIAI